MRVEHIGDATLYLASCEDVLPTLGKVDAVVTDPPYGIGAGMMSLGKWRTSRMAKSEWDSATPSPLLLRSVTAASENCVIWGGNYFGLPPSRKYLVWDKGAGFKGRDFAECEMAWCSADGNARVLTYDPLARGDYRDKQHPTQKPVTVMEWSIRHSGGWGITLDPFMGSGSTGVACVALGLPFIGIEREPAYFDIACRRIAEAYAQPRLFEPSPPAKPVQPSMFEAAA